MQAAWNFVVTAGVSYERTEALSSIVELSPPPRTRLMGSLTQRRAPSIVLRLRLGFTPYDLQKSN